ncbi:MAG: protein-L-isoaspartate O-methyltransferase [Gammaproteobacteria bacterium]|nr:protein-L-isoaspartate O-methyltransferase [Gammaproteobacteria bacterium]
MAKIDFDQARFNMVEQQIRTWNVLDMEVLEVLKSVPREGYVPDTYRDLAYTDMSIPIGHGEEMLHPKYQAHILHALKPQAGDSVLQVGVGTGYVCALLAKMADRVYGVDVEPDFLKIASQNLAKQNVTNVILEEGDASCGWSEHGPYDAIALTGAVEEINDAIKQELKIGGRLFAFVGNAPTMQAVLVTRTGDHSWEEKCLFESEIPSLHHDRRPPEFDF